MWYNISFIFRQIPLQTYLSALKLHTCHPHVQPLLRNQSIACQILMQACRLKIY